MTEMIEPSQTHKSRSSYSVEFKKKAVKLAKKSASATAAARQLNIPVASLYYWLKNKRAGLSVKKLKRKITHKSPTRRTYTAEFKLDAVKKAIESFSVAATARELKIAVQTLHNWMEAEKAGRLGAAVIFTLDELRAVEKACTDRVCVLKKSTAVNSSSASKDLDNLLSASAKLKRFNK